MAPIHHDTNAFTNVFLSLGCLARPAPPSSHEPSGSQGYLPPPSPLPVRFDSSISPSCDTATLSVGPNDAENKKWPTFFSIIIYYYPCSLNMIGNSAIGQEMVVRLTTGANVQCISKSLMQFTKRCQTDFDNHAGFYSDLLRKYL